jgi:hypothetical protein
MDKLDTMEGIDLEVSGEDNHISNDLYIPTYLGFIIIMQGLNLQRAGDRSMYIYWLCWERH